MGKKRKLEEVVSSPKAAKAAVKETAAAVAKVAKKDTSKKKPKKEVRSDSEDEDMEEIVKKVTLDPAVFPPPEIMMKLLDRIESQLPKEDHVKFDSRARKLDWNKVAFDGLNPDDCKKTWNQIQERIRRFRILAEMIPDARTWITQPWTNFYKSKDHNRHPDMPKKPLSMYMLFYSEMREEILKTNPAMSMPEVAKACSEKYQKLSDKKKNKYKTRCDEMRKEYEEKMENFYRAHPELKPVKADKAKKAAAAALAAATAAAVQSQQQQQYMQVHHQQHQQPHQLVATITSAVAPMSTVPIQMDVLMQHQQQQQQMKQQHKQQLQQLKAEDSKANNPFPNAPERPPKPFDLYFKSMVDDRVNDPNFDRQSTAEKCRQEWKNMKLKKKAKWIRKASERFREYEDLVAAFQTQHPTYVPADKKNFLTQEDQKILDKFMGRPEKPPSSAYSLFSKEMLNHPEIKTYPSKERMSHISERWKLINQDDKDHYQAQVNESMSIYRQLYEQWFNGLTEEERRAETARINTSKSKPKAAGGSAAPGSATKQKQPAAVVHAQQQQQPQPVTFTMTPMMSVPQQIIVQHAAAPPPPRDVNKLRNDILQREPVEPARSPKQLYVAEWLSKHKKKKAPDAKEAWKALDKKEKKKWVEKLEPQRQKYIEAYTVFVRGLDKEELELYTDLKSKRDQEEESRRQNESSDSEDSETSESESESDSDSESD